MSEHGLVLLGGLAAVGKTSEARFLFDQGWSVFDKDGLSDGFARLLGRPTPESSVGGLVRDAEYAMLDALERSLGTTVPSCIVAPYVREFCDARWVSERLSRGVRLVWMDAPETSEHQSRMSKRGSSRDTLKLDDFESWLSQSQVELDPRIERVPAGDLGRLPSFLSGRLASPVP